MATLLYLNVSIITFSHTATVRQIQRIIKYLLFLRTPMRSGGKVKLAVRNASRFVVKFTREGFYRVFCEFDL